MADNNNLGTGEKSTRRTFVRASAGLIAFSGLSATTKANPDTETEDGFAIKSGELVYHGSESEEKEGTLQLQSSPEHGERVVHSEADLQEATEVLNELQEQNEIEYVSDDGEVYVRGSTSNSDSEKTRLGLLSSCGKNDYESDFTRYGPRERLYMDDTMTRRVRNKLMMTTGGSLAAAKLLTGSIKGIPVAVLAGVLAAVSAVGTGLLTENNDGCGVRVTHYQAGMGAGPIGGAATTFFDPQ